MAAVPKYRAQYARIPSARVQPRTLSQDLLHRFQSVCRSRVFAHCPKNCFPSAHCPKNSFGAPIGAKVRTSLRLSYERPLRECPNFYFAAWMASEVAVASPNLRSATRHGIKGPRFAGMLHLRARAQETTIPMGAQAHLIIVHPIGRPSNLCRPDCVAPHGLRIIIGSRCVLVPFMAGRFKLSLGSTSRSRWM